MLNALVLAFRQLLEPEMRRPLFLSILWTLATLIALWVAVGWAIEHWTAGSSWLLRRALEIIAALGTPVLSWILFPSVVFLILGFFSDAIIVAVEQRYYPDLPPPSGANWLSALFGGLRLAVIGLVLNIVVLILGLLFLPSLPFLFFALNGYMLGREYFNSVALRRLSARDAKRLWRRHRMEFVLCGGVAAGLFLVPFINLIAPMVGTAASVHLVEKLRQSEGVLVTG